MALSKPVYNTLRPFYLLIYLKMENKLTDRLALPNFSEVTWIWTLKVSMGWMIEVARAPDKPPIIKGAKVSKTLRLFF
jgi:hypothetical protein